MSPTYPLSVLTAREQPAGTLCNKEYCISSVGYILFISARSCTPMRPAVSGWSVAVRVSPARSNCNECTRLRCSLKISWASVASTMGRLSTCKRMSPDCIPTLAAAVLGSTLSTIKGICIPIKPTPSAITCCIISLGITMVFSTPSRRTTTFWAVITSRIKLLERASRGFPSAERIMSLSWNPAL